MSEDKFIEELIKINYFPQTVFEKYISLLFGLIYFQIVVEDRRPDLDSKKDSDKIKELGYKYKSQIRLKFFQFERSILFRSIHKPSFFKNGKELDY